MAEERQLLVDCRDARVEDYPALHVRRPGVTAAFVFDSRLKDAARFDAAVFVDESAFSLGVFRYPRNRRIAWLQETPLKGCLERGAELAARFDRVLTFDRRLLSRGAPFVTSWLGGSWINDGHPWRLGTVRKTGNVSFVGSIEHPDQEGYAVRRRVAQFCRGRSEVDSWGRGIRSFARKDEVVAPYRFSVCMENTRRDYYFTEKLIDCFVTDTVPVYWGCPGIGDIFDPRGLIVFDDVDDLCRILPRLTPETYDAMRPYLETNRERVFELGLDTHQALYGRIADCLRSFLGAGPALAPFVRSRPAAAWRWAAEAWHAWRLPES